ncbi:sigma-70 family RNA polymerase sigma factor [Paractinoplanes ferrugineus]|uniref:RNA polymerase sigma factor n=1 Tax=Paractinoplanes ferrugineus TaxID=113564 RepID=A0A919J639_9ACTN|nr:sigma-70 family RNA polymerase sigma factor [Actinoplanes ferrugineus]GIE14738.1 RNA polymerase sigma factor [Actinoplanes ferrugineus]
MWRRQQDDVLAARFEANRPRLRAVALRMLGSAAEADDAVQEAWLRLSRTDQDGLDNLAAWLTTVVGRICLDMLRRRTSRREDSFESEPAAAAADPEQEALLADSVGLALLVVLETLTPAERLAFVLHDLFAVSFEEIAPLVGRSPDAARQLASRARRRVRAGSDAEAPAGRAVVDAFLVAARGGDLATLLTLLDPDVEMRVDEVVRNRGAESVAAFFDGRARTARTALVDGRLGIAVMAGEQATVGEQVTVAARVTIVDGRIAGLDATTDPAELAGLAVTPI